MLLKPSIVNPSDDDCLVSPGGCRRRLAGSRACELFGGLAGAAGGGLLSSILVATLGAIPLPL
jgi:hypothetical protein